MLIRNVLIVLMALTVLAVKPVEATNNKVGIHILKTVEVEWLVAEKIAY